VADLLVTGTDTGVGKTVVAAALLLALRERGLRAVGFKPVETGLEPDGLADSELLAKASGVDEPLARPLLRLSEALAPALAAERAGLALEPTALDERLRALRDRGHPIVLEGAGGLLVPLVWGVTVLDLAVRHELEVVIVARPGLGTLNHTLLTYEALARRHVFVRGIVLCGRSAAPDLAEQTNPQALARLLPAVPIVVVPRHAVSDALEAAYASVPFVANLAG
jgi:dethiobiotin synthetase